jgi:hypothetical protein
MDTSVSGFHATVRHQAEENSSFSLPTMGGGGAGAGGAGNSGAVLAAIRALQVNVANKHDVDVQPFSHVDVSSIPPLILVSQADGAQP